MLTQEDYWMIQELQHQGVYRGDIAKRLGVHARTVSRVLKRGGPPSGHAAAKGTPSSNPTWQPWTNYSRPASSTPWSSFATSRRWDTTARFAFYAPTSSPDAPCVPAAPPCVSRPNPPSNCSMTGVRSSSCRWAYSESVYRRQYPGLLPRFHVMAAALLRRRTYLREPGAGLRLVRWRHPAGLG